MSGDTRWGDRTPEMEGGALPEGAAVDLVRELAEQECKYGDGCPKFSGSRHGTCIPCKARAALLAHGVHLAPSPESPEPAPSVPREPSPEAIRADKDWICQHCLTLITERECGSRGDDGVGHLIGDEDPSWCGPCVPLADELDYLLDQLRTFRRKHREEFRRTDFRAVDGLSAPPEGL